MNNMRYLSSGLFLDVTFDIECLTFLTCHEDCVIRYVSCYLCLVQTSTLGELLSRFQKQKVGKTAFLEYVSNCFKSYTFACIYLLFVFRFLLN